MRKSYNKSVFINCPIDSKYKPLFRAAVFAVVRCGFFVRCAEEERDSSNSRLLKITSIIKECKYGIHDLSRVELDARTRLPRFNMPFEFGIFYGAKYFGDDEQSVKSCLVFEKTPHSYEKYISDIKGQDIEAHQNKPKLLINCVHDFLHHHTSKGYLPGGLTINKEYGVFSKWLPPKCKRERLDVEKLDYHDYVQLVYEWLELNGKGD